MTSLIIAIIAVVLIALLALATLFFGSDAFNKGAVDAEAAKIVLQGQQLLGTADMYFAERSDWPPDLEGLVSEGYLSTVPAASSRAQWEMPTSATPLFLLSPASSVAEVCAAVNAKASLQKRVVLPQAYSGLNAQCFQGQDDQGGTVYKVVFKRFTDADSLEVLPPEEVAPEPFPPGDGGGDEELPPYEGPQGPGAVGSLQVSEQFFDFGAVRVNAPQPAFEELILTNTGDAPVALENAFALGDGMFEGLMTVNSSNGAFAVAYPPGGAEMGFCDGNVPAGESCALLAVFYPTTAGQYQWPFLLRTSAGEVVVTLRGLTPAGDGIEGYTPVPQTIDLGAVAQGEVSQPATATFRNTSRSTMRIAYLEPIDSWAFSIDGGTCEGATLAPGATCTFSASLDSSSGLGDYAAAVWVDVGVDYLDTGVQLQGSVVRAQKPSSTGLQDYGTWHIGQWFQGWLTFQNTTDGPLTVDSFSFANTPSLQAYQPGYENFWYAGGDECQGATLEPGQSCEFGLYFSPNSSDGTITATVQVQGFGGAGQPVSIPMEGLTLRANVIRDKVYSFPSTRIGSNSATQTVTLTMWTSDSYDDLIISEVETKQLGGPDGLIGGVPVTHGASHFRVLSTDCIGRRMVNGDTCTAQVSFQPRNFGDGYTGPMAIALGFSGYRPGWDPSGGYYSVAGGVTLRGTALP